MILDGWLLSELFKLGLALASIRLKKRKKTTPGLQATRQFPQSGLASGLRNGKRFFFQFNI